MGSFNADVKADAEAGEPAGPAGEEPGEDRPPVHYSTGRLTRAQMQAVNAWRARLRKDRPLPGEERTGRQGRMLGCDDRPRASCSDVIAAAVTELLARGPEPMTVARHADATWKALKAIADGGGRDSAAAPAYPPVSWYLPADLADQHDELRQRAWDTAARERAAVRAEALKRYPRRNDAVARAMWYYSELAARGIPARGALIPGGTVARTAIDAWARRSVDQVCAAAVDYAAQWHQQPHRGRRDMRQLQR